MLQFEALAWGCIEHRVLARQVAGADRVHANLLARALANHARPPVYRYLAQVAAQSGCGPLGQRQRRPRGASTLCR